MAFQLDRGNSTNLRSNNVQCRLTLEEESRNFSQQSHLFPPGQLSSLCSSTDSPTFGGGFPIDGGGDINPSNMPKNYKGKRNNPKEVLVGEEIKISVNIAIQEFRHNETKKELEFPSSLNNTERAYIHGLAQNFGLKSKSKGKGASRYLTLFKKEKNKQGSIATFDLTRDSRNESHGLLQRFPVNQRERLELQPRMERRRYGVPGGQPRETPKTTGRLNNGIAQTPAKRAGSDLDSFRQTLPVYLMKDEIMQTINRHRVVMISGETGSGKTTQIPQFILDESFQQKQSCRILCTQPRRLSALSIAERVAAERGESIGQAVGYQIRLESRVSPKTVLTFCTNGVLLRTLMAGDNALQSVTHIIVDEIHERDRFCDFLLIQLREVMVRLKHLKVILMSAALDTELFVRYFNNCPLVSVPGKIFEVEELFLEDALKCTGYTNDRMQTFIKEKSKLAKQQSQLNEWYEEPSVVKGAASRNEDGVGKITRDLSATGLGGGSNSNKALLDASVDVADMPDWLQKDMDSALGDCWLKGTEEAFAQLMHLVLEENVSADYAHAETSATALMLAAGRGNVEIVERLLSLGANATKRASNDMTAIDWAKKFNQTDVIEVLQAHITNTQTETDFETDLIEDSSDITAEDKELLQAYHHSFDDERVDIKLIIALLTYILDNSEEGAILVFLPGYDDIVSLRDTLLSDESMFSDSSHYQVYTLHSSMQSSDQKKVFRKSVVGVRKIVLSTNIAETSVTINDVVFVIDSGKVKEKSFDALTSVSMLKSNWISKASAKQRKGRAGRCRPGMCFHLMSRVRYKSLAAFQTPEILRLPLQELCLHTKLLAPVNMTIAEFLSKAADPPAILIVKNAVQLLKAIDAIDNWEDLTELGHHLADLPVEPRLGKMMLYSIVLKCLDPVLTIVCALAYRDPFVLPNHPSEKRAAMAVRKKYAANTYSDHMALLRAFQAWQRARSDGWERAFCVRNYLSQATMEMIVGMRTQLLGQLRASGFVRARGPGDIRDLNTNSENWAVVKASLCAGMYPNIIKVDRERKQLTTQTESKIRFHPNSVLHDSSNNKLSMGMAQQGIIDSLPTDWLIYEEMTRFHRHTSIRCTTVVSPLAVALFTGPSRLPQDALVQPEDNIANGANQDDSDSDADDEEKGQRAGLKLDDWIVLRADTEAANLALLLRQKWHTLFLRRMRMPAKPWTPGDEAVLRTIVKVLSNEEQALGLQQPVGVGQRPKPMAMDHFNNTPPRRSVGNRFNQQAHQNVQEFRPSGNKKHWGCSSPPNQTKTPATTKPASTLNASAPAWQGKASYSGGSSGNAGGRGGISGGSSGTTGGSSGITGGSSGMKAAGGVEAYGGQQVQQCPDSSLNAVRYFIMKCHDPFNIELSFHRGLWCVSPSTAKILSSAFQTSKAIFLFFAVQGSNHFQGFSKMTSDIRYSQTVEWRDGSMRNGAEVGVQWIKRANVSFNQTRFLLNQKVQMNRDGQELEPSVGEKLLQLWARVATCQAANNPQTAPSWGQEFNKGQQEFRGQHQLNPDSQHPNRSNSPQGSTLPGQNWSAEGGLQPIAHSSPAYYQGPAAYCKKGTKTTEGAVDEYPSEERNSKTSWTWSADDGSEGGVVASESEYQPPGGYYSTH
ncbi:3'-5' RNA helicase YTHDC2-like isoform X2 [Asterias amurensis]|uniref:3'-5' RNA helicase YTHDC2-like isoform X2 n=1 Tax=Asterias amurensis TaxID=7602 RepID=UPI003AB68891